jgi:hypothetical protein
MLVSVLNNQRVASWQIPKIGSFLILNAISLVNLHGALGCSMNKCTTFAVLHWHAKQVVRIIPLLVATMFLKHVA